MYEGRCTSEVYERFQKNINSTRLLPICCASLSINIFKNSQNHQIFNRLRPKLPRFCHDQLWYANIESIWKLEKQRYLFTRLIILTSFAPNDTRTARDLSESGRPSPSYFANMADRRRCWEPCSEEPERQQVIHN